MKRLLRCQRGGVALIMVLAFLALGTPVVTSTLNLADSLSMDSRTKRGILEDQYCGLAVVEYVKYLNLDLARWDSWWSTNQDPNPPEGGAATETVTICGQSITLKATRLDGVTDDPPEGLANIPPLPAYNNRTFQTTKTADVTTASPGEVITYTITVQHRDTSSKKLTKVHDLLPPGFCYEAGQAGFPSLSITSGSTTTNYSVGDPQQVPATCPNPGQTQTLTWSSLPNVFFQTGDYLTLTFKAKPAITIGDDEYCNEAWAEPGNLNTRSGKTARIQIGVLPGTCDDKAVEISKEVVNIRNLSLVTPSDPQQYSFTADYSLTVKNIGESTLKVGPKGQTKYGLRDLLPLGFCYQAPTVYTGPTTQGPDPNVVPPKLNIPKGNKSCPDSDTRQQLDWDFSVDLVQGQTATLAYSATATVARGDYWSDLLVNFDDSQEFPEAMYTWPAAVVTVKDAFDFTVTLTNGTTILVKIRVVVGNSSGTIAQFEIQ